MGLDTVEIVLRTEEVFGINLPDEECAKIITVGDLYRAILTKLNLAYTPISEIEWNPLFASRMKPPIRRFLKKAIEFPLEPNPATDPWTTPEVWLTLKTIITDQLQIEPNEVREQAAFLKDLGCD